VNDNLESPTGTTEEHVRAEHVEISQGGVSSIDATTVNLQQGGAGRVRATDMSVSQGGVGLARAQHLRLQDGASAFAVVADDAAMAEGSNVAVLIARTATGDVRPLLDWRAAAAFGAAFGLALRLLRRR
jgi:hypothetical protein